MTHQSFQALFALGMKRAIPPLYPIPSGEGLAVLNLGCGNSPIAGTVGLDWPEWDANRMLIPYGDGRVAGIHAYHFLEHVDSPVAMLREFQRVLIPGGIANIVVPYYNSQMMHQDLTHRTTMFCEATWANLFANPYYSKDRKGWEFTVGFNLICGIVERNLCLMTQLIRR